MATVYGTNFTNAYQTVPAVNVAADKWDGNVKIQRDTYEASGLASGSTIKVGKLPAGARIVDWHILADDLGTTAGTLEAGDSGDTDRFLAAYATGSATFKSLLKDGKIDNIDHQYTAPTEMLITTAGASITGTIKSIIFFVVD